MLVSVISVPRDSIKFMVEGLIQRKITQDIDARGKSYRSETDCVLINRAIRIPNLKSEPVSVQICRVDHNVAPTSPAIQVSEIASMHSDGKSDRKIIQPSRA